MTAQTTAIRYRERLLPGIGFFSAWLLIVPATALVMMPIQERLAIPVAIGMYVLVSLIFIALSPVIEVRDGSFRAGRATIPVGLVGEVEPLGSDALRDAIGPGADARNYLVVRGWVHRGLKIEITDAQDPTPHWIVTSRKPVALAEALKAAA
ncbi:DUF3093 domain-containing protein [Leucobacter komagatae]|uniref:DUF3093 family protein n=1 Tax=Leucobacter komagatae TaxID=55969 RepID=A0A0D0H709_9MICO|nr:DUF3093 domain-containing protein [Leucobacter komagatae]KIP52955.1 hypothetical protein SD72_05455 [Leucobacter komagatae]